MELIACTDLNLLGIGFLLILRSQDVLFRTSLVATVRLVLAVATVCLVLAVTVAAVQAIAIAAVHAVHAVHAVGPVCLVFTLCAVLTRGTTILAPLSMLLEIYKYIRSLSLSCVNGKTRHLSIPVS